MICDKLWLMWKKEKALTTVDSKDEVLGRRLPVALNEQDGVHLQVKINHCCNTTGSGRTARGSCHSKHLELRAILPTRKSSGPSSLRETTRTYQKSMLSICICSDIKQQTPSKTTDTFQHLEAGACTLTSKCCT